MALDAEESASLVREVYGARRRKNPADMTALVSDGDIRVCSNCCQVCESEHGNAMKYKNIREVFKSTGEAMTVSGTYYEVLQKGLQKLRVDVATFNELATKLRRFEGISEYDRASAMRTQALTDFTTQDKLSKKLIVSAEGHFFSVGLEPLRFPRRALLFAVRLHRSGRMLTTIPCPCLCHCLVPLCRYLLKSMCIRLGYFRSYCAV
jgi:hypothetical protein